MANPRIPQYHELMWPALEATKALGGSATTREMYDRVVADQGFGEDLQAITHDNGPMSELDYRLHWARTHLKGIGALENSRRGVWAVTDHGRSLSQSAMQGETKAWRERFKERRRARQAETSPGDEETGETWRDELISTLLRMPPDGFERLAQRLLRESGFGNVVVTGRSGDGGIDGRGTYRLSLVSFPVFFQCKRYKGSVTAGTVRDFRGAMVGRGEKGLLITTGSFTKDAQAEATRDGAPPIELIDGENLCDLLKEHRMGVEVTLRTVEDVAVVEQFFKEFD